MFALKKTRASGRNVGKVFNPVAKLVLENQPFLMSYVICLRRPEHVTVVTVHVVTMVAVSHTTISVYSIAATIL